MRRVGENRRGRAIDNSRIRDCPLDYPSMPRIIPDRRNYERRRWSIVSLDQFKPVSHEPLILPVVFNPFLAILSNRMLEIAHS